MKSAKTPACLIGLLFIAACSTYKAKPQMHYYHGETPPKGFVTVLRASPEEIEFEIRIKFPEERLYHLVLEGDSPVAEGWFPTIRGGRQAYTVIMKPGEGMAFEPGKTYRLCIGQQNPQLVQMYTSNYRCWIDYSFVFQEKS